MNIETYVFGCRSARPHVSFQPRGPKLKTPILSVSTGRKLRSHPPLSLPLGNHTHQGSNRADRLYLYGSCVCVCVCVSLRVGGGDEAPHLTTNQSWTAYQGAASLSDDGDMRANPRQCGTAASSKALL